MDRRFVAFEFDDAASEDVSNYFFGAATSERELFESHRAFRALIQQVREHSQQKIGTESQFNDISPTLVVDPPKP